jgi:hypothetical protein
LSGLLAEADAAAFELVAMIDVAVSSPTQALTQGTKP